ncbi:nucleotidyltransferase [Ruminococcus gauvreauii]|uniref:tRNA(Met) cytidine acetate ligase n=1 Tax=Ruminococcus gauvreauii TaxID=438033 RepID=A0ABY5VH00_9FIRM|nr:nucleotidyltransferase [Ruminococcus gauvreauii]UWP59805.1 nucleotidyltransferase [Ruminococcus gauvreauii]
MKITGLITEYNPFHNGHKYHIEKAREVTGADFVIAVMSGNFVQRGSCAVTDKYTRAAMALSEGVSLVLELPACFATGSAEFFARGAVRMLRQTGVTDSICFGCEQASLPLFHEISAVLADEPEIYRRVLKSALSQGQSYPSARQQALSACLPALDIDSFLQSPNNILGLEYIRALNQEPGTVVPFPIQRIGSGYHDKTVTGTYSSATAIRREIHGKQISSSALEQLPPQAAAILKQQLADRGSLEIDRFSPLLKYALLSESAASLCRYQDMTEALANRIMNRLNDFISISSFISLLKTRELTYSRISRALLHVMLKLTDEDLSRALLPKNSCLRILGFRKDAGALLKELKQNCTVPVITKPADAFRILNSSALTAFEQDIRAAHVYETIMTDTYHIPFRHEYTRTPVII